MIREKPYKDRRRVRRGFYRTQWDLENDLLRRDEYLDCQFSMAAARTMMSGHERLPPRPFATWFDYADSPECCENPYIESASRFDNWFRSAPFIETIPITIVSQNYRAKCAGLPHDLTREQWGNLLAAFGSRCAYCGSRYGNLTIDHFIPVSKGGGTTVTNVVPACFGCNSCKGATDPFRYFSHSGKEAKISTIRDVLNRIGAKYGKPPVSW